MSARLPNGVFVIAAEKPDRCTGCAKERELRPYGRGGARLCFECASLPENSTIVEQNMERAMDGKPPL